MANRRVYQIVQYNALAYRLYSLFLSFLDHNSNLWRNKFTTVSKKSFPPVCDFSYELGRNDL